MKLFKQLAAATMASALFILAPVAAYADPLPTPASIKGVLINEESEVPKAAELGVSQVITNFPISWIYQPGLMAAYESYLKALKEANIAVTVIVLNDWDVYSYNPDLLPVTQPTANYYAFNTLSEAGLTATLDAANQVAEKFGGLVSNWIIGNEINDGQAWNYIGPMDIDTYCAHYALAFRMWYFAIKNVNSTANVYIPYDFRWNTGHLEGLKYGAMDMLPRLNTLLQETDYGIAWHAYPEEFDSPVFLDDRNALEQINTPIINLKNLHVLTDYMSQPGMLSPAGTVRHLILSEQGFTSFSPIHGGDCQELQAQSIVQAYQAAAANPYVEAFMLNRLHDVPSMLEDNYAFGLIDIYGVEKLSWEAYKALP